MKNKRIFIITLSTLMLFFTLQVMGANLTKSINATFRNIKIKINGTEQKTDLEPFIYNDSTYVPLRFISEKLGSSIAWDDKTSTISINQDKNDKTDSNAVNALKAAKAFCADAYDVYRVVEVLDIKGDLYYNVEASGSKSAKINIYYNPKDGKLYSFEDGEVSIFQ